MPETNDSLLERVRVLERQVADLTRTVTATQRVAQANTAWPVRLAKTRTARQDVGTGGPQDVYPNAPTCRLPIVFLNAECADPWESLETSDRSASQQAWALITHWVPEGSRIAVFRWRNEYYGFPFQTWIKVRPQATIQPGDSGPCTVYFAGQPATSTIDVWLDWCAGDQEISADKDAWCIWVDDQQRFEFMLADCE